MDRKGTESPLKQTFSTAKERVEFGLDTIPEDRTVTVSLRDLMYVHQVLGEYMQFFHQRMHYPKLEDVHRFLGDASSGEAFEVLGQAYYHRIRDMIPPDLAEAFDANRFEHPLPPRYFAVDDEET